MALAAKALTLAAVVGMLFAVGVASPVSAASTNGTSLLTNFAGPFDPTTGPPDATLAAAPTRIVELVNSRYAIVNREGLGITGPIRDLVGASESMFLSDPQVAWDPGSNRFYYSIFENRGRVVPTRASPGDSRRAVPLTQSRTGVTISRASITEAKRFQTAPRSASAPTSSCSLPSESAFHLRTPRVLILLG